MKTAIVYDRVNKWGGAERVLLALHEMFPNAPLYTSVYDAKKAPWAEVFPKIYTSFLQKIPFAKNSHELFGWLMPLAFESFNFDGYDLVISVTSEAAKGIVTKPQTKHICYCLTPTRYLWSGYDLYFQNPTFRFIAKPAVSYLRAWDKIAAQRPDVMISISTEVKNRIKRYYNRESVLIYPPVKFETLNSKSETISKFKIPTSPGRQNSKFYLVVSRLVPYKRVDLAVKAFNQLKLPLCVVGTGSEEWKLKLIAKNNIKFLGQVSEERLVSLYEGAKALIMPQEEDFGLVAVEAQAAGTPVIAYKKGGVKDSVIDGKTGIFFDEQTPESLIAAIEKFDKIVFNPGELEHAAKKFPKENFKRNFLDLVK